MRVKAFLSVALLESIRGYLLNKRRYISKEAFVSYCCSVPRPVAIAELKETEHEFVLSYRDSRRTNLGQEPLCCILKNTKIRTYFVLVFNKTRQVSSDVYKINLEYGVYRHVGVLDYWDFLRIKVVQELFRSQSYGGFDSKQLGKKVVIVGSEFYKKPKAEDMYLLHEFYVLEDKLFLGDTLPFWLEKRKLEKRRFLLTAAMWE